MYSVSFFFSPFQLLSALQVTRQQNCVSCLTVKPSGASKSSGRTAPAVVCVAMRYTLTSSLPSYFAVTARPPGSAEATDGLRVQNQPISSIVRLAKNE